MPTFNEIRLAIQGIAFLDGVRRQLRASAQGYKDTLARGTMIVNGATIPALDGLQPILASDRTAFAASVSKYQALVADVTKRTSLTNGLAGIGVALSEAQTLVAALGTAITSHATMAGDTEVNLGLLADAVLAQTPVFTGFQPEP